MGIQKPDLSSVFCSELRIYGHATLGGDYLNKIPQLGAKKRKRELMVASAVYTINRRKHTCVILLPPPKKLSNRKASFGFRMTIESGSSPIQPKGRKPLDALEVVEQVVRMGVKVKLYLTAYFEYPRRRVESIISLPYDTPVPPLERVQVAGLRINVKKSPDEEYSQIVDIGKKGSVSHVITFEKRAHVPNGSFLIELLAEASKYSKRLIKKRGKDARE